MTDDLALAVKRILRPFQKPKLEDRKKIQRKVMYMTR